MHAIAAPASRPAAAKDGAARAGAPLVARTLLAALAPSGLKPSTLDAILPHAELVHVEAGQVLFERGAAPQWAALIFAGQVALGRRPSQGEVQVVASLRPGDWVDPAGVWLGEAHPWAAWVPPAARDGSTLLRLPREVVVEALARPDWAEAWTRVLARQARQWTQQADDLLHLDAEGRCALWLLRHADKTDDRPCTIELSERKRTIAAQLGMTPETLSRVLRELSRKGLIEVQGYVVQLREMAGLRRCASMQLASA